MPTFQCHAHLHQPTNSHTQAHFRYWRPCTMNAIARTSH
jgi:hypothetical protein